MSFFVAVVVVAAVHAELVMFVVPSLGQRHHNRNHRSHPLLCPRDNLMAESRSK